jgi:hypothetical protein
MLRVVESGSAREAGIEACTLDELAREGAPCMLAAALKAEAAQYVEACRSERDAGAAPWWCATGGRERASSHSDVIS